MTIRNRLVLKLYASARVKSEDIEKYLRVTADGVAAQNLKTLTTNSHEVHIILPQLYNLANVIAVDVDAGVGMIGGEDKAPAYSQVHNRQHGKNRSVSRAWAQLQR